MAIVSAWQGHLKTERQAEAAENKSLQKETEEQKFLKKKKKGCTQNPHLCPTISYIASTPAGLKDKHPRAINVLSTISDDDLCHAHITVCFPFSIRSKLAEIGTSADASECKLVDTETAESGSWLSSGTDITSYLRHLKLFKLRL